MSDKLIDSQGWDKFGKIAGKVTDAYNAYSWVKDALTMRSDTPAKGFEFVPTADSAEMRQRTPQEVKQGAGLTAIAGTGAGLYASKNVASSIAIGGAAHAAATEYLENTLKPTNHFLTQEDHDRINGEGPTFP